METPHTIFFIGKPGCGKGTQAKLLADTTGWPVFGSGKLFRALSQEDTPVGHKMKIENDAGLLSPHWFAMYLYLKSLFSIPQNENAIFDGFNRKMQEAELIIDSLAWLGRSCTIVHIEVSDEEIRRRLVLRKETDGRADDGVVGARLKEYYEHTEPVLAYFREKGVLLDIQGEQSPEAIAEDIKKALAV